MADDAERLLAAARDACQRSYSPYSEFPVGAAVSTEDGGIFIGTNIENASFGLTICAERVAIFHALVNGATTVKKLAVAVGRASASQQERMPCGACRQVMAEFMKNDSEVIIDGVGAFTLESLLPNPFTLK